MFNKLTHFPILETFSIGQLDLEWIVLVANYYPLFGSGVGGNEREPVEAQSREENSGSKRDVKWNQTAASK